MNNFLPPDEQLINKEASLAATSLGNGLTYLRKTSFAGKGYYYQAFFSLSTGVERLIKLILIQDYRLKYNKFPDNKYIKKYSHNLNDLFDKAKELAKDYSVQNELQEINRDDIFTKIIESLSAFANSTRYYNLDTLTNSNKQQIDPLVSWSEVTDEIAKRHFKNKSNNALEEFAKDVSEVSIVFHSDEKGNPITNFEDYFTISRIAEVTQKYSVLYTGIIIRFLAKLFRKIERERGTPLDVYVFFAIFIQENGYFLRKKIWDPYRP